jgi:N utilization substance protein B
MISRSRTPKRPRGSAKARRTAARLAAVQALYQMTLTRRPAAEIVAEFAEFRIGHEVDGAAFVPADLTLLTAIVRGADAARADIDRALTEAIQPPLERTRLEILLQAILTAAGWELLNNRELPAPIIIAEYVSVTSAFYGGQEPGLINGILDRVARTARAYEFPGAPAHGQPQPLTVAPDEPEDDG